MRVQEEGAHGDSGEVGEDLGLGGKCLLSCELVLMWCVGAFAGAKEVPADVKAKVKKLVSGHAAGIKGADFPREWEKQFAKTPLKETWAKLGFKKMAEFLSACSDVLRKEEDGTPGNIKYYPKGK